MKIIALGDLEQDIYSQVGGKARGLDFLKKHGYNIADGFVVTEIGVPGDREFDEINKAFDALGAERVSVRSSASNEGHCGHLGSESVDERSSSLSLLLSVSLTFQ